MKKTPTFSIIVPTFNRPETLPRAVASVSKQTFRDFELIVVDDCSSTGYAQEVCRTLDIQYTLVRNEKNSRASGARNVGIVHAKGRYISFLDDDDEYEDTFLQSTYSTLRDTDDDVAVCWCSATCINYFNNGMPLVRQRLFPTEYATKIELFEQLMSIGTGFGVTVKAECFDRVGLFDSKIQTVEDADFFLRILSEGYLPAVVPGAHVILHNHTDARLTSRRNDQVRVKECNQLLAEYSQLLGDYPRLRRQLEHHVKTLEEESFSG